MFIRILADLHIGALSEEFTKRNIEALESSILNEDPMVDVTFVAGDLFHKKNLATRTMDAHTALKYADELFAMLKKKTRGDIIVLSGNHDNTNETFLPLNIKNTFIVRNPTEINVDNQKFVLWPWVVKEYKRNYDSSAIFIGHVIIDKLIPMLNIMTMDENTIDSLNVFSFEELSSYHYAFCGHIHLRYIEDTVVSIGQPWHTAFAPSKKVLETKTPGYILYNTEYEIPLWKDIDTIQFLTCESSEEYEKIKDSKHHIRLKYEPKVSENVGSNVIITPVIDDIATTEVQIDPELSGNIQAIWNEWCNIKNVDKKIINKGMEVLSTIETSSFLIPVVIESINKLTLTNIGPHDFIEVIPEKTLLIKGRSGAGKTFILEAILHALYCKSPFRSSVFSIVTINKEEGIIEVEITTSKGNYIIKRYINSKKKTNKVEIFLENEEIFTNMLPSEKNKELINIFGPYDRFLTMTFLSQNRKFSLVYLNNAERRDCLSSILDLDITDAVYSQIKPIHMKASSDLSSIGRTISNLENRLKALPPEEELLRQIELLKSIDKDRIERQAVLKKEIERYTKALDQVDDIKNTIIPIISDLGSIKISSSLKRDIKVLEGEIAVIDNTIRSKLFELNKALKSIEDVPNLEECKTCPLKSVIMATIENTNSEIENFKKQLVTKQEELSKKNKNILIYDAVLCKTEESLGILNSILTVPIKLHDVELNSVLNTCYEIEEELSQKVETFNDELNKSETESFSDQSPITVIRNANPLSDLEKRKYYEEEILKNKEILTSLEKELEFITTMVSCFKPQGAKKLLLAGIIPTINKILLETYEQHSLPILVTLSIPDPETNCIDITVVNRKGKFDIDNTCGGERMLADLLLRLALSKLKNRACIFFGDEVFDGLGDEGQEYLSNILDKFSIIKQLIVSSHINDVNMGDSFLVLD